MTVLNPMSIPIPLVPMNQKAPKSAGPVGRIESLTNAIVKKIGSGDLTHPHGGIKIEKRDAIKTITQEIRDVTALAVATNAGVPSAQLIAELDASTVEIGSDSGFYALGSDAWMKWPQYVIPNVMRRVPIWANNSKSAMPDVGTVGTTGCFTFRSASPPSGTPGAWFMFRNMETGTTIQIPGFGGYGANAHIRTKVVSDGSRFWVFLDHTFSGTVRQVGVNVFDSTGNFIAGTLIDTLHAEADHWDVTYDSSVGVCLARIADGFGVVLSVLSIASTTISISTNTSVTAGSRGSTADWGIAFLRSNEADGHVYVACINAGDGYELHVVRLNAAAATEHDYVVFSTGFEFSQTIGISNITGYVVPGTQNVEVAWTQMPLGSTVQQMNCQLRTAFMDHAATTPVWNSTSNKPPTKRSAGVASRAFLLNGRWVCAAYYPSVSLGLSSGAANQFGQPTFCLLDIAANQICGRFEWAQAAMDWVTDGWTGTQDSVGAITAEWFALPSAAPSFDQLGAITVCPLAYRGTQFVQETDINVILEPLTGTIISSTPLDLFTSTVGVIAETFGRPGTAIAYAGELLLPGPLPASFTGEDLGEINVMIGAEQPTITTSNAGGSLSPSQAYQWVLVEEWTNTQGQRVKGAPCIPVSATTGASDNRAVITIHLDRLTSHTGSIWSVYRTWLVAGVMSTVHRKVTSDLSPVLNSTLADTIVFNDTFSDSAVSVGEQLYTDGINPPFGWRYPAPPFTCGEVIGNLVVVAGYDNALWASYEKVEGEALSFSPTRRVPMPTDDPMVSLSTLDNRILIQCAGSQWYVDNVWPDATGAGSLPTPIQLPYSNGAVVSASVNQDGVYYASSEGGIWKVDRGLSNTYVGGPVEVDVKASTILSAVTDQEQRVWFLLGGNLAVVYDTVVDCWYRFALPTTSAVRLGLFLGQVVVAESAKSYVYSPGQYGDGGGSTAIITTVQLAPMAFAGVPGLQMVWTLQFLGEALGPHTLTVSLLYDDGTNLVEPWIFASANLGIAAGNAYRWEVEPANPECQAIAVKLVDSFPGGASQGFSLESIGAEVGLLPKAGNLPFSQRVQPSTLGSS